MRMKDISGKHFGYLIALKPSGKAKNRNIIWECRCICGKTVHVKSQYLFNGNVKSCGCMTIDMMKKTATKHGFRANKKFSHIYRKWLRMKDRCLNPNCKAYQDYGGRGITICDEWLGENGAENFAKWAYANGYDENTDCWKCTLDRIDVNGNYEPSNCRIATIKQQANNTRRNIIISYDGEERTLAQWAEKFNIPYSVLYYKIAIKNTGMERALSEIMEKPANATADESRI